MEAGGWEWAREGVVQEIVKGMVDFKVHLHLSQMEGIRIPRVRMREEVAVEDKQVPHSRENFVMNSIKKKNIPFEKEVRLDIEVEEEPIRNSKRKLDIGQEDEKSYDSDESVRTFDMISDIGIEPIRKSKAINNVGNNPKFFNAKTFDIEFEETGREETKDATADQGTPTPAYFKNGEWLKWVPER